MSQSEPKQNSNTDPSGPNGANTNTQTSNNSTEASASASILIKTSNTKSEWELTWPIWHMLPRDERKSIANKHGMKTIGEFEEYMSLHKAESLSAAMSVTNPGMNGTTGKAYANSNLYGNLGPTSDDTNETSVDSLEDKLKTKWKINDDLESKLPAVLSDDDDEDEDEDDDENDATDANNPDQSPTPHQMSESEQEPVTTKELMEQGGAMLTLPTELHHKILSFLEVDYYSLCALVHPTWSTFTRTELTYQTICQRLYMKQSRRKKLRVHKFQNSYRNMLLIRPRVRTGTGFYILKYKHVKKIQRDMWTEIPVGAVLESVYYRYLYFFENGRVLYALTTSSPLEMVSRIQNMVKLEGKKNSDGSEHKDKHLVWGRYEVRKFDIQVRVKHSWCNAILDLKIISGNQNNYSSSHDHAGTRGKFCTLAMVRHRTSTVVDFDVYGFGDEKKEEQRSDYQWWNGSSNIVEHDVPTECFRFLRDWRL